MGEIRIVPMSMNKSNIVEHGQHNSGYTTEENDSPSHSNH